MRADRLPFALTLAAALVAGPVFGTARADDAAKVQLTLKLEKGAVAAFDQSQSSVQNITMSNGMPNEQSNDTQREWTQTVESTTDGAAAVQVKFGRFKGSASSMMGVMEFDSAEPADPMNPMAAFTGMFTALSGKTATVKIAKDGKLGDVTGIDGVAEAATGGMGGMGGGMVKGVARAFASPDAAKSWLRGVFPKLPEKPVGVGDTWTDEWTQDFAGGKKVKITLTFKATSIDAESVSVSLDGKFALEESAAPTTKDGEKPALPGAPGMPGLPGGPGGAGGAGG
ncbi:MAG: hypothetical protein K8T90_18855, partial [Planctomycetes bacterium]|nr:hypothetical protein [Planctomycetota bacterium]